MFFLGKSDLYEGALPPKSERNVLHETYSGSRSQGLANLASRTEVLRRGLTDSGRRTFATEEPFLSFTRTFTYGVIASRARTRGTCATAALHERFDKVQCHASKIPIFNFPTLTKEVCFLHCWAGERS